jgi:uncharacterized protein (DUF1697 family)
MTTWIALLRGIGLGRNKLPMKDLVQILEQLGLRDVRTYIQTGNAVFRAGRVRPAQLAQQITAAVEDRHGFAPRTMLMTLDELNAAIAANPFPEAEAAPGYLHLTFLEAAPPTPDLALLDGLRAGGERFALDGKVFYLHTPEGYGRSKLAARVEKALGVQGTARNWRSVTNIRVLARELDA